jgi:hypothetical protein
MTVMLVAAGQTKPSTLDDRLLDAVLSLDRQDWGLHALVYHEWVIRVLLCHWCAGLGLCSHGTAPRWRVAHEADCLIWQRYQQHTGGETAEPSGALLRLGERGPKGTVGTWPNTPGGLSCGTVTWRGPYKSAAAQEAATRDALPRVPGGLA